MKKTSTTKRKMTGVWLRPDEKILLETRLASLGFTSLSSFAKHLANTGTLTPSPWRVCDYVANTFRRLDAVEKPHRQDWTEDMLEGGWRPLLEGEIIHEGDEVYSPDTRCWGPTKRRTSERVAVVDEEYTYLHHRTKRSLPESPISILIRTAQETRGYLNDVAQLLDRGLEEKGETAGVDDVIALLDKALALMGGSQSPT